MFEVAQHVSGKGAAFKQSANILQLAINPTDARRSLQVNLCASHLQLQACVWCLNMQVIFGRFEEDGHGLRLLVQQASNIAWLHCALSLSDWVLMISMPSCLPAKLHVGITTAVTFALVQTLRHTAQNTN